MFESKHCQSLLYEPMKKAIIFPLKTLFVLFASVGIAHAKTPEEFCLELTEPAYYYFDAKAHGGVPAELLTRWLLIASSEYYVNFSRDLIADLGAQVETGELNKLEAMQELFGPCVEKYRIQWN